VLLYGPKDQGIVLDGCSDAVIQAQDLSVAFLGLERKHQAGGETQKDQTLGSIHLTSLNVVWGRQLGDCMSGRIGGGSDEGRRPRGGRDQDDLVGLQALAGP